MEELDLKNKKSQLQLKLNKLRKDRDYMMYLLSISECHRPDVIQKYMQLSKEINKIRDEIDDINNEILSISSK